MFNCIVFNQLLRIYEEQRTKYHIGSAISCGFRSLASCFESSLPSLSAGNFGVDSLATEPKHWERVDSKLGARFVNGGVQVLESQNIDTWFFGHRQMTGIVHVLPWPGVRICGICSYAMLSVFNTKWTLNFSFRKTCNCMHFVCMKHHLKSFPLPASELFRKIFGK